MVNLQTLEELRTRKEVEDYFKKLGKEITEEELDTLKQNYDKAQKTNGALTMQQLDDVAGGIIKGLVHIGANDAHTEHTGIRTMRVSYDPSGEFVDYTFEHINGILTSARNVFLLEPKGQNPDISNIEKKCIAGTYIELLISSKQEYSAIKVGNAMYLYNRSHFDRMDKRYLENFVKTNHVNSEKSESFDLEENLSIHNLSRSEIRCRIGMCIAGFVAFFGEMILFYLKGRADGYNEGHNTTN